MAGRRYEPPPPRPPRRVRLGSSSQRLRAAVVVLAFVLSLFGARLVQLQGLDAPTYAAEAEQGRLRTVDAARGARHHHRPQRRGPGHHRRGGERDRRPDAGRGPRRDRRGARPGARSSIPPMLQARLTGTRRFVYVAKAVTPATWHQVAGPRPARPHDRRSAGDLLRADQQAGLPGRRTSRPTSSASWARTGRVSAGIEYALEQHAGRPGRHGDVRAERRRPADPQRRRHRARRGRRVGRAR